MYGFMRDTHGISSSCTYMCSEPANVMCRVLYESCHQNKTPGASLTHLYMATEVIKR